MSNHGTADQDAAALDDLFRRVRAGQALPILSHTAMFDLALFGYQAFKEYYAGRIHYPYDRLPGIGQLVNYDRYANQPGAPACKRFFLECYQEHIALQAEAAGVGADALKGARAQAGDIGVSQFAELLGYPRFDQPQTRPLQVLANLPFTIYLVVGITTFLEAALRLAGRDPLTRVCRWSGPTNTPDRDLWLIPDDYVPSEGRPLVYHLCGLDAHPVTGRPVPDYLALSEDDHLEMLVNLSQDRGHDGTDRLPGVVRGALWGALVLLGFRLDSWAFRGLYYGLIRDSGQQGEGRGLCTIQLDSDEKERQVKYLQGYLERQARFGIFWGDLYDFARRLEE